MNVISRMRWAVRIRGTVKKIYGVMSGRDIVTEHRRCPRCDTKLEE